MGVLHDQVVIRGIVVKPQSGVIQFTDGKTLPGGKDWFRSAGKLSEFEKDEPVECTFQVSPNRVYLLKAVSLAPNGTKKRVAVERDQHFVPGMHNGIYFEPKIARLFDLAWEGIEKDHILFILLRGESGYGKSSYAEAFAKDMSMKFVDINCAAIGDPEEWFGYREAENGSTKFVLNEFSEAVREGNCIINFDEGNRIESYISNTLMPMLDHRRKTVVHKQEIVVGPRVIFTMTINEGPKFAGTFNMDTALKNRIDMTYKVGPLLPDIERQLLLTRYPRLIRSGARAIVEVATQLREAIKRDSMELDCSTRTSLKLAAAMTLGASFMEAIEFVIQNIADESDMKPIIDIANMVNKKIQAEEAAGTKEESSSSMLSITIETEKPMPSDARRIELVALIREIASVDMAKAKQMVEEAQSKRSDIHLTFSTQESFKSACEKISKRSFVFKTGH